MTARGVGLQLNGFTEKTDTILADMLKLQTRRLTPRSQVDGSDSVHPRLIVERVMYVIVSCKTKY